MVHWFWTYKNRDILIDKYVTVTDKQYVSVNTIHDDVSGTII